MGLLPEIFMLLGIDVFLAMSLLSALLDNDVPSPVQYLFQAASLMGLAQLFISKTFIDSQVFSRDPLDATRFWIGTVYLAAACASVVGLNLYLAMIRRRLTLATTFTGTVTVPTVMTSVFFVYAFLGTGGNVVFDLGSAAILGIAALVSGVSILGFLRQAIRHFGLGLFEKTGRVGATAAQPSLGQTVPAMATLPEPLVEIDSRTSQPEGGRTTTGLPIRLPARRQDEWEEAAGASEREEDVEGGEMNR